MAEAAGAREKWTLLHFEHLVLQLLHGNLSSTFRVEEVERRRDFAATHFFHFCILSGQFLQLFNLDQIRALKDL